MFKRRKGLEPGKGENGKQRRCRVVNKEILIWKVLKLGIGPKSGQEFISALESKDFFLSEWAKDLLSQPDFTVTNEEMEIKLVKSSLLQLGLKSGGRLTDICEKAGRGYGF